MSVLRFFATLFLLLAIIALVSDLTPWLAGASPSWKLTSLDAYWLDIAPGTHKSFMDWPATSGPAAVLKIPLSAILNIPAALLFLGLALFAGWGGRRRTRVKVFAN